MDQANISEPRLMTHASFKVIGIGIRTTNKAESNQNTAKIPGLWSRFYQEAIYDKIPDKASSSPVFGVYSNYESDDKGPYNLTAAAEVTRLQTLPVGMVSYTVPSGKYFVFSGKGKMPEIVMNTWKKVWDYFSKKGKYRRAYTVDFEQYLGPSEVKIYIAIKSDAGR